MKVDKYTKPTMQYVYVLREGKRGKAFYTGVTEDPIQRAGCYEGAVSAGIRTEPVNQRIKEIGSENVVLSVILKTPSEKTALKKERENIARYTHVSRGGTNVRRK